MPSTQHAMSTADVLAALEAAADPSRLPGMARVGIETSHALGVSVPNIRKIAKRAGTDQALADTLWATGIHEARMVAALVADPATITARTMRGWAADLDSWDVTDMLADALVATPRAKTHDRNVVSSTTRLHQALRVRDDRAVRRLLR